MCLVLLAWQPDTKHQLVMAANRDEFFARPAVPIDWWDDQPNIIGGRDLEAGGTWLALGRHGRFAVVTNFRDPKPAPAKRSRGDLIPTWLSGDYDADEFRRFMEANETEFAGFNLLYGDQSALFYFSNRSTKNGRVAPGYYALSNAALDADWPKMVNGRAFIKSAVLENRLHPNDLAEYLRDRSPAPDRLLPQPFLPLEQRRLLSAPFIMGETYGTRCSTIVTIDDAGEATIVEQQFAPLGKPTDIKTLSFKIKTPTTEPR